MQRGLLLVSLVASCRALRLQSATTDDEAIPDGPKPRVALLLRGESFRSQYGIAGQPGESAADTKKYSGTRSQVGPHKRSTCEGGEDDQKTTSQGHVEMVKAIKEWGYDVDIFAVTYNCSNGLDYASRIPGYFAEAGEELVSFEILPQKSSNMQTTMAHVFRKAFQHNENYAFYISHRIDQSDQLTKHKMHSMTSSCFFDAIPRDGAFFNMDNIDFVHIVPQRYASDFLDFLAEDMGEHQCCNYIVQAKDGSYCQPWCNGCMGNFLKKNGLEERGKEFSQCGAHTELAKIHQDVQPDYDANTAHDKECLKLMYPEDPTMWDDPEKQ